MVRVSTLVVVFASQHAIQALIFNHEPEWAAEDGELDGELDEEGRPGKIKQVQRKPWGKRVPLVSWDLARQKAQNTSFFMFPEERRALVHGSHSYHPGWYVGNTLPMPRLKIPALTMQDAGNGFRPHVPMTHGTTVQWPSLLALAATWDEGLSLRMGIAMAQEFREKGSNVMLGPAINVHRIASNGRNFEYLSGEDPYLGSRLVKPFVEGVQSEGVMAVVKHFAFNEQETNRGTDKNGVVSSSNVEERTAWELYYPPFQAAVDAGVGAFMCSYNKVNGTHACENKELLNRDLKQKMGFMGFVMSDWGATHNNYSLSYGLDQDMPGGKDHLLDAFELFSTPVRSRTSNEAVVRVLTAIYHLRLDEHQKGTCQPPNCLKDMMKNVRTDQHVALAREVATKSIVLLKNEDKILPIDPKKVLTLAVLGTAANQGAGRELLGVGADYYSGGGSGHVSARSVVTPLAGIKERAREAMVKVLFAANGSKAEKLAKQADMVVVVGATTASEGKDRASLYLDHDVDRLILAVAKIKPTVVLMQTPGAVLTPWRDQVKGIANLFLAGEETGNAWAALLFGDAAPTGRLPIMFPATANDVIQPEVGDANYKEGIFTSYRSPTLQAAFPFGHGLSFTSFSYDNLRLQNENCPGRLCYRMHITNSGDHRGVETAQVYLRFPKDVGYPSLVLRGFQRTKQLNPSESHEVMFVLTERDLSVFKEELGWQVQPAEVHVGPSSADIRQKMYTP